MSQCAVFLQDVPITQESLESVMLQNAEDEFNMEVDTNTIHH